MFQHSWNYSCNEARGKRNYFFFPRFPISYYCMKSTKLIFFSALLLAFFGCQRTRTTTPNVPAAERASAETERKPPEPKKYGSLYSDTDLDAALKRNDDWDDRDPLAYYYAGDRCADSGDYQEAAKLYAMALETFEGNMRQYSKIRNDDRWKESYPGMLDENGECREFYYSIYNISCCLSILGLLEQSEAYLYNAIIAGYPHLKHLLSDPDLENLYASPRGEEVKEKARNLFACGNDANFFAGKDVFLFEGNDGWTIHFNRNGTDAFLFTERNDRNNRWYTHGTYTVRNFHILIHVDSRWEKKAIGHALWGAGGIIDQYDAYALPVLTEKDYLYMLSPADAFDKNFGWWYIEDFDNLMNGTFLEGVTENDSDFFFRCVSCADFLERVFASAEDIDWHPEDDAKNREQNRLNEERRLKQAQTALIELSKEEIAANAKRRLERHRAFAEPIVRGYREQGTSVALSAASVLKMRAARLEKTNPTAEKTETKSETEFCFVSVSGRLNSDEAFESICKEAEERFPAGCFLDFTDCESGGFACALPATKLVKGIIFPKNATDVSVDLYGSAATVLEFQDCTQPVEIYFGYYKDYENSSLAAVRLPEGLETIGAFSFMNCTALEQVYAPKSLAKIERYAFSNSSISSFEIPENVRFVEESAFDYPTAVYVPAYRHHPENFDWYYGWYYSQSYSWHYECYEIDKNVYWGSRME